MSDIGAERAPKPLRVLAWVLLVLEGWSLVSYGLGFWRNYRISGVLISGFGVAAALGILRGRRWGYWLMCGFIGYSLVVWIPYLLRSSPDDLAGRLVLAAISLPIGVVVPAIVLLLPSSRRWVKGQIAVADPAPG